MAADLVPEAVPDPAAAEGSRYYKSVVPEQQHDKPTAYKVKVGGTFGLKPTRLVKTFVIFTLHVSTSDEGAWEDLLPAVELAYNCTTHSSTGLSPFEVMIGENPLRASDLDVVDSFDAAISPPMTKLFQQLVDRAAANILRAQAQQKHYADAHRQDVSFSVVPAAEEEDPVFEVDHLLDSRGSGVNEEFLVKWKGFPAEQATWEPLSNLGGCKDLLRAFRASQRRRKKGQHKPP
ncbi:hypothetical protein Emag_007864 [Eimeria magna]